MDAGPRAPGQSARLPRGLAESCSTAAITKGHPGDIVDEKLCGVRSVGPVGPVGYDVHWWLRLICETSWNIGGVAQFLSWFLLV